MFGLEFILINFINGVLIGLPIGYADARAKQEQSNLDASEQVEA